MEPRCCKCKKICQLKCSNCGEFYCSEICQDNDWAEHRFICLKKPALVQVSAENIKTLNQHDFFLQKQLRALTVACEAIAQQVQQLGKHGLYANDGLSENALIQRIQRPIENLKIDRVIIVCIATLNKVYVCPENNYAAYLEVLKKVEEYGEKAPFLRRMPGKHSLVMALRGARYCRAKVAFPMNGEPSRVRITYIDYGNFSTRRLIDLRQINLETADLPVHVAEVTLKNVINIILGSSAWQSVLKNFERKIYVMKGHSNDEVELFEVETGDSLNEKIITIAAARSKGEDIDKFFPNKQNSEKSPDCKRPLVQFADLADVKPIEIKEEEKKVLLPAVMSAPFETHVISRAERNVKAIVIDTAMVEHGYVACILKKSLKDFNNLQAYLKEKPFDSGDPYVPQHGEYVIAEYRGEWYRGQVVGVQPDGNNFEIFYVDFLNQETVGSHKIRHYPIDLTIACNTQLCSFSGLPKKSTPEIKTVLKNQIKIKDKILIDRVVDLEDGVALIECRQILDLMIDKNLI